MSKLFAALNTASLLFILFFFLTVFVNAQTTVFTYQGRFTDSTLPQPTNAHYEMEFKLFDPLSTQIGTTQTIGDVSVVNGIFTVQLDFGESSFRGANIFLETSVRPLGSANPFTILAPRQPITTAPISIRSRVSSSAENSNNADALGGFPASNYVQSTDVRLFDDRNPLAGNANYIQNQTANSQAANFNIAGNATIGGNISGNGANVTNLNAANITTGTLLTTRGGTGLSASGATGNFLRSNGTNWTSSPLTSSDIPANLGSYVQNSTVQQTSSNFNISGTGTVGGTLSGNIVNAATQFNINNSRVLFTDANDNFFAGKNSGTANTGGFLNSFFGNNAGAANKTGNSNSFFGNAAGQFNDNGVNNSFFGNLAGAKNIIGGNNSFFGKSAGENNSSDNNSFFGAGAGQANISGSNNAFFGSFAGFSSTTSDNSFFGSNAGQKNVGGTGNSFFGRESGRENIDGNSNSFFGRSAGLLTTSGDQNTFFGFNAGQTNTTGSNNTLFGFNAGNGSPVGMFNSTGIGFGANPQGNQVTVIGYQAGSSAGIINSTAIGANAFVSTSNTVVIGTASTTTENPGILKVLTLGAAGSTSLCRNSQNQISTCTAGNFTDFNNQLLETLQQQNRQMLEQLKAQQAQIEELKTIVCATNPAAKICTK